jgi:hypothetical protein
VRGTKQETLRICHAAQVIMNFVHVLPGQSKTNDAHNADRQVKPSHRRTSNSCTLHRVP